MEGIFRVMGLLLSQNFGCSDSCPWTGSLLFPKFWVLHRSTAARTDLVLIMRSVADLNYIIFKKIPLTDNHQINLRISRRRFKEIHTTPIIPFVIFLHVIYGQNSRILYGAKMSSFTESIFIFPMGSSFRNITSDIITEIKTNSYKFSDADFHTRYERTSEKKKRHEGNQNESIANWNWIIQKLWPFYLSTYCVCNTVKIPVIRSFFRSVIDSIRILQL